MPKGSTPRPAPEPKIVVATCAGDVSWYASPLSARRKNPTATQRASAILAVRSRLELAIGGRVRLSAENARARASPRGEYGVDVVRSAMARRPSPTLTEAEYRLMNILWDLGSGTVAE